MCWRVGSPTGGPFPSSSLVQSPSAVDATAQSAHARSTHHARPLPPPPGPSWRPLIGSWTADIPLQTLTPPCQYVMQIRGATWHFWCTDPLQGWPKVPARRGCGQRSPGAHCGGGVDRQYIRRCRSRVERRTPPSRWLEEGGVREGPRLGGRPARAHTYAGAALKRRQRHTPCPAPARGSAAACGALGGWGCVRAWPGSCRVSCRRVHGPGSLSATADLVVEWVWWWRFTSFWSLSTRRGPG